MTREEGSCEPRWRGRATALITCDMLNAMLAPVQASAFGEAPDGVQPVGLAHPYSFLAQGGWL